MKCLREGWRANDKSVAAMKQMAKSTRTAFLLVLLVEVAFYAMALKVAIPLGNTTEVVADFLWVTFLMYEVYTLSNALFYNATRDRQYHFADPPCDWSEILGMLWLPGVLPWFLISHALYRREQIRHIDHDFAAQETLKKALQDTKSRTVAERFPEEAQEFIDEFWQAQRQKLLDQKQPNQLSQVEEAETEKLISEMKEAIERLREMEVVQVGWIYGSDNQTIGIMIIMRITTQIEGILYDLGDYALTIRMDGEHDCEMVRSGLLANGVARNSYIAFALPKSTAWVHLEAGNVVLATKCCIQEIKESWRRMVEPELFPETFLRIN